MKFPTPLIVIAIAANILTVYQYVNLNDSGGGEAMTFYLMTLPLIWLPSFGLARFFIVKNKRTWQAEDRARKTELALLFCTPIPFFVLASLPYLFTHYVQKHF
jgi:4-amino-4-deoxy-L-arabinose transferase-like glycosyltransferase